jgi:hypothetical protein
MASCERCNQMTDDPALQNEVWKDIACRLREPAQGSVQRDRVREEIARTPSEPTLQGPGQGTGITAHPRMPENHPALAVPVEPKQQIRKSEFVLVSIKGAFTHAQAIPWTDHSPFLSCGAQIPAVGHQTATEHNLARGSRIEALLNSVRDACRGPQHKATLDSFCRTVKQAWSDVGEKWPGTDSELHISIKRRFEQLCADLQSATCSAREDPGETPEKLLVS